MGWGVSRWPSSVTHGGDGDPGPAEAADAEPVEAVPAGGRLADDRERDLGLGLEPPDLFDGHRRVDVQLQEVAVGPGEPDGRGAGRAAHRYVPAACRPVRAEPSLGPGVALLGVTPDRVASGRRPGRSGRSSDPAVAAG